jgi:chemotaxis protein MotA
MDKKIEFSTFLGISAALLLILAAAAATGSSGLLSLLDLPSVMIVFGGTFFVTCACFTINDVVKALSTCGKTVFYTSVNKKSLVSNCVKLAEISKKDGILSLQKNQNIYGKMDRFFKKYIGLIIDGLSPQDTEKLIVQEIYSIRERHKKAVDILRKGAEIAPAMGLIGTLVGLVQMLGNLSDPSTIGPSMAVALLTTFYGAMTAFVILTPLATKLERNSKDEIELLKIYGDAVIAIAKQEGPMRLEMRMNANLSPEDRVKIYS